MSGMEMTGAEWLARTLAANGTTHVFFIDAVLRRTLIELGTLGVNRVLRIRRNPPPTWPTVTRELRDDPVSASPSRSAPPIWPRDCRTRGSGAVR